ncbi:MAG: hypothetical protein JXR07_11280 [Reichenbachiella sp.]
MPEDFQIPTKAKVYLNKPYVQLYWDGKSSVMTNRWVGFCTFEEILAVGKRITDAVIFEKAEKILYDAHGIEVLDEDSQKYISGAFTREMISAGIKYAATVFPKDVFAKFCVDDIQKKLEKSQGASINYFDSLSKANLWLISK